ncbi:hypothetical protein Tco_0724309 [Tanacetum coccineum]
MDSNNCNEYNYHGKQYYCTYAHDINTLTGKITVVTLVEEQMSSWKGNLPKLPIESNIVRLATTSIVALEDRIDIAQAREIAQLKREKLEIQRRTLELAEREKRDRDILFYNSAIDTTSSPIQQEKLIDMNMEIKARYNLNY